MVHLIDRRVQGKNKSAPNRERFLRRYKGQIKEAVARAIKGRSITDFENGENIRIPVKDVSEPTFGHDRGGVWETVQPGNQEYLKGDQVARPKGGAGSGKGQAGNSDELSEDDFVFQLSREEFMNYFFEDLELPNLIKTQLASTTDFKSQRAGYKTSGTTSSLHVLRSLRGALGRRIAVGGRSARRLKQAEAEMADLLQTVSDMADERIVLLKQEIHHLRTRLLAIPFIDPFDLRYSNRIKVPKPSTQAVMFCLLDVSGSMDEQKKEIAKRFFILLYLFLTRAYEKIDVVFIRHHTAALEVDENEFFHSRESGGTIVSSALHLLTKIIKERYPSGDWNAYVAQASDGDNWDNDSIACRQLLINTIMPLVQYYAYVEITEGDPQNLWEEYAQVTDHHAHFAMQKIRTPADIYPVFRELFKKQSK
ncbi:YeaH/YhbH family protein [Undibacterium sp. RTI2.1]|uniref:YeaH/YhbH family protein n=1 Tax=unclassified Undibacterium TaxID=2630295 RepID=UPI002AB46B74|nr:MULTISPECIES: YeaH/YhbH family protein [unclassified Undibacterium]MDY7536736.1 YeaH/YhbH family protein [Undibacterium sp. 5I1]MEB0032253.1 YeaH/YhbH family protein [Undibacterium sp. RTI2.1]MEB0115785.1 YeaH/YhbH family protein [Undibacterium sp. RTI2.2]MEB0231890.1 YeaH/YhbH family protein [Undibacterium sp. 10I3]MEB0256618.1 YeaH/YhbH family protein [Undibacterium sp. 5I1]